MQYFKSAGRGQFFKVTAEKTVIVCQYDFNPSIEVTSTDPKLIAALKAVPCSAEAFTRAHAEVSSLLKAQADDITDAEYFKSEGGGQYLKVMGKRLLVVCAYDFAPAVELTTSNTALIAALKCQPITRKEFRQAYPQISDYIAAQAVTVPVYAAAA